MTYPSSTHDDDAWGNHAPQQPWGPPPEWSQPPPAQPYPQYAPEEQPYPYPQAAVNVSAADGSNNTSLAPVTSLVTGLIGVFIAWIHRSSA